MTIETVLPELVGVLANLPEYTQRAIRAYGAACARTALQSDEVKMFREIAYALIMFQADYEQCAGQSMPDNEHWSERLMQIVDMADAAMERRP